jgi:hypothetical protein
MHACTLTTSTAHLPLTAPKNQKKENAKEAQK